MFRKEVSLLILIAMTQASIANPVAQMSGSLSQFREYAANTEITDFQADQAFQGFSHDNGRLKVQGHGSYYIYAQVFFESRNTTALHNCVALTVNGAAFSLMQTGLGGQTDYGSLYAGGVIPLQWGDYISLVTVHNSYLWVTPAHTFFGAYRIEQKQSTC